MKQIVNFNREEDHPLLHAQRRLVRNALKPARQETIITTLEENRTNPKRSEDALIGTSLQARYQLIKPMSGSRIKMIQF